MGRRAMSKCKSDHITTSVVWDLRFNHFRQFEFMTDAVDELLIRIEAPKRMKKDEPKQDSIFFWL